jgi:hypothetical protein
MPATSRPLPVGTPRRSKQAALLATPITPTSNAAKGNVQNLRASHSDLGILMTMLEVDVITLMECLISRNRQLSFPASELSAVNDAGVGRGSMR